jgi:hypothetical protein
MNVIEFCDKFGACRDGRDWAVATGEIEMAAIWKRDDLMPEWRIWIATRPGVLTDRELRLFACWSVRQVWHLLTDERSRNAVEVAERYANGEATANELASAGAAAWWAAGDAARAAWWSAGDAAGAAWWAAGDAARAAARAAARDAQSRYLLDNTTPAL